MILKYSVFPSGIFHIPSSEFGKSCSTTLFVCLLELADLFKKTFEFNADSTTYQPSMSRAFSHNFEGQLQYNG